MRHAWPARRPTLLAAIVLTLLVFAIFRPILDFEFVNLDTIPHVVANPHIRGLTADNLKHIFTSRLVTSYYPVRTLSWALDHQIWGLNPRGFKLTNILIHLANVFLILWLVLRFVGRVRVRGESRRTGWDVSVATFSASLFAIHPVVVEPVTWVSGREELLMTLGALGCLHFHLTARSLGERGAKRAALACYAGAAFACAVACLSNALGAVIPLLISTWDVLTLARPKLRRIFFGTCALWAIGVATIVVKKLGDVAESEPGFELFDAKHLMLVLNVYWLNCKTLVWPTLLTVDYWKIDPRGFGDAEVVLGATALVLTCLVGWMLRRQKLVLFGLAWFGLALGPASQIMPHHLHRADRFLYLPLVGLAVALGMGLCRLTRVMPRRAARVKVIAGCLVCLSVLGVLSTHQVQTWRSSISMWAHCVRVVPHSAFAHDCLAESLAEQGRFAEAIPHSERALSLAPDEAIVMQHFARRLAICRHKQLRDYPRAIKLAERGCQLTQWKDQKLLNTLAVACMNYATDLKGNGHYELAIEGYRKAIEADPKFEVPLFNLALLLATCSEKRLRRPDEAVRLAEKGCQMIEHPNSLQLSILAQVYAETGRFDQAVGTTQKAIRTAQAVGDSEFANQLRDQLKVYEKGAVSEAGAADK